VFYLFIFILILIQLITYSLGKPAIEFSVETTMGRKGLTSLYSPGKMDILIDQEMGRKGRVGDARNNIPAKNNLGDKVLFIPIFYFIIKLIINMP
jgi:hypothetical protein